MQSRIKEHSEIIMDFKTRSYDKALKAWNILNNMTDEQRRSLKKTILLNKKYQEEMCTIEKEEGMQDICNGCETTCCGIMIENVIDEIDYFIAFYTATEEERSEIMRVMKGVVKGNCSFLGEKGCVFPKTSRPHACKSHYCSPIENTSVESEYNTCSKYMNENLRRLIDEIRMMGFEIC